jgi:hypothetical protein
MHGTSTSSWLVTALALLCVLPSGRPAEAFPRGGGGFGGGGFHFGGAGYDGRGGSNDWQRGYQGWHPQYGPQSRPAWTDQNGKGNAFRTNQVDSWKDDNIQKFNQNNYRNNINNSSRNNVQDNVNVNNNFYTRNVNGWNANWARGGYWSNRPWNAGWYAWTPASWGWWGGSSVGWGLAAGLATGAAITDLVNSAASREQTVIVVPSTTWTLNYASVEAVGLYGVSFSYALGDGVNLNGAANCQAGLLNGQVPASAAQAQLLNAVCQVAYGKGG